jgi:hypothetical protein
VRIIRPAAVTDAALVATSVPEVTPAWAVGTTYGKDARVQDPVAHREYESQQPNNVGHALSDVAWWVEVGATNRWRMFDQTSSSQTVVGEELLVDVKIADRVNAIALLNCEAAAARITATVNGTIVYDKSFPMTSSVGISTWYDYFFEPIERRPDLIVTDLPLYSNMLIRVRLTRAGGMVRVGSLIVGQMKDLGITLSGLSAGIADYSRKGADDFGNVVLVERPFAKKLDCRIVLDTADVDKVHTILSALRATPLVWIADDRWVTTALFGFYRNFSSTFEYEQKATCLLELEGLT